MQRRLPDPQGTAAAHQYPQLAPAMAVINQLAIEANLLKPSANHARTSRLLIGGRAQLHVTNYGIELAVESYDTELVSWLWQIYSKHFKVIKRTDTTLRLLVKAKQ